MQLAEQLVDDTVQSIAVVDHGVERVAHGENNVKL